MKVAAKGKHNPNPLLSITAPFLEWGGEPDMFQYSIPEGKKIKSQEWEIPVLPTLPPIQTLKLNLIDITQKIICPPVYAKLSLS